MYSKAISKYFLDINMFNVTYCLIFGFMSGFLWSLVMFSSFGILIGYLGYQTFKKNEYYAYYNLGFTKADLLKKVWLLNTSISIFLFLIYLIFK
ncbi:hypothetical protein C7972_102267 [Arenibacter sp. ARW7G5Y1]|nr:hypothetical protein C7972_102267 [Arenibacter sp. ARW7G5Y1]